VILTGIATNIRVLFTANDAYMRDPELIVPSDCVALNTVELNEHALDQIRTVLRAKTPKPEELTEDLRQRIAGGGN
jgi:nicotinamidase-related amidase